MDDYDDNQRLCEARDEPDLEPSVGSEKVVAFNPSRYLMKIEGRDYLEVKWRLLWLRSVHPDAAIHTELVRLEDGFALFKADVFIPGGYGSATGWGSEVVQDFNEYIEAAETKAIGRALSALGYGTQFCQDFDFAVVASREAVRIQVVDAPVSFDQGEALMSGNGHHANGNGATPTPAYVTPSSFQDHPRITNPAGQLTDKQLKAIYAIGHNQRQMSETEVEELCEKTYGIRPSALSKAQASRFIDILKQGAES